MLSRALALMVVLASFAEAVRPTGCGDAVPRYPTPTVTFDVRTYGGVGDGTTMNTKAFAGAVAAAHANPGGGIVVAAAGRYLTGTVQLLNNTFLYVAGDAVVIGSAYEKDYIWASAGQPVVILAERARNVGIFGGGVIDGQALPMFIAGYSAVNDEYIPVMWTEAPRNCVGECRPRLVEFYRCDNVLVRDVTLQNSADWTSHYLGCSNVLIQNITVFGDFRWPNNDGIDPDSSVNVTIDSVSVNTGDDGVCPKSTLGFGPLTNLLVTNSILRSRSSAFKIGSGTQTDISNVLVENVFIWDSNRGLGIQHRDQGNVYDVEFRDVIVDGTYYHPIKWWGAGEPIWVTTVLRCDVGCVTPGTVSDIRFVNVTSRRSANGVFIGSRTLTPITNLSLTDVTIHVDDWRPARPGLVLSPPEHDWRPATPPGDRDLGNTDVFYFEGVDVASASMERSSASFGSPRRPWWGACMGGDAVPATNCSCQL